MNMHGGALRRHPAYWLKQFSLGNWGQKESLCFHQYGFDPGHAEHRCDIGELSELIYVGLVPKGSKVQNDFCGDPNTAPVIKENTAKHYNEKQLREDWNKLCTGKPHCNVDMTKYLINTAGSNQSDKSSEAKLYSQYVCDFEKLKKSA
mgnify:CR=1 FL=1